MLTSFLMALAAASAPRYTPATSSAVMMEQSELIAKMSVDFNTKVDVQWEPCGEVNSYYLPRANVIHLCAEVADQEPGAALFIAAHEMSHAILWQKSGDLSEYAADELAALYLLYEDDVASVQGGAAWFIKMMDPKYRGAMHPSDAYRGVLLLELADGYLEVSPVTRALYIGTLERYRLRLNLDKVVDLPDDED